jgi:Protein of unknown function (DUF4239)
VSREVLNAVSTGWLLVAAVVLSLGLVLLCVRLVRHFVPGTRDGYHAEVSAPMLNVVAAVFGLLLAFVIVIAYQNFLGAQANVSMEADALASIVRDSDAFPGPGRANVHRAVGTYVRAVVRDEWPEMRNGDESTRASNALDGIFAAFRTVEPRPTVAVAFYDDAVRQLNATLTARRDRLRAVSGGIPSAIGALLLFSALVIVGYAVLVGSPNYWFHALGAAAIAVVIAVSLVVLIDLSYPFSGSVAIAPNDFMSGPLAQFFHRP